MVYNGTVKLDNKQKKQDQQRNSNIRNNRIEKLKHLNKGSIQNQIDDLEKKLKLSKSENQQLKQLKDDLGFMSRYNIGHEKQKPTVEILGKKSIFYDPDWNPDGVAPENCKNITYNKETFIRRKPVKVRLGYIDEIKLP